MGLNLPRLFCTDGRLIAIYDPSTIGLDKIRFDARLNGKFMIKREKGLISIKLHRS